ncbi:tetratricopeptide repeat protein [Aerosakkonema sp. BLCC-F183]|uniref:CHAT domain-containing protein n=1 Tax=Aerosakkonema sp. BLCC-F183 TaxID=3342834 RepID=UPI0035B94D0F
MKRIISGVLALGVCLTPLTVPLMVRPSWGQSENPEVEEIKQILEQADQQEEQGQPLQAIATLQHFLALARQYNVREAEAFALLRIGFNYNKLERKQEALDFFNQALAIYKEVNDRAGEAMALNNIGAVYKGIGQPQEALKYFNQALPIVREANNRTGQARTLNNIGAVYLDIGQPQEALKYYHQALPILREVNDRASEATTLNNIGLVYDSIGQPQEALKYYNQALPILREVNDRAGEATTLNNIGAVYNSIGQPQEALKYSHQALPIMREVNDRAGEAATLNNIGAVYNSIGQPQEALKYYNQALPILREVNDRAGEAATLTNIGAVYDSIGQPQEALKYYNQALPIMREVNNRAVEATTLNNIGLVYNSIGQPQEALKYYNQALPIMREVNDRAGEGTTLNSIGGVYDSIGQPQEALKYYNQALPIRREVNDRAGEATTLSNIGAVYRNIGQSTQAISNWEQSVAITLEMRAGLQKENRRKFLEDNSGRNIALISLLIDQNQPEKAFQYANRFTTADLADYTRLINVKVSNPQAQQLIDQWNQKNEQIQFLYRQFQSNPSNQLSQQINAFQEENNKLAEDISRQFPEIAELFETTLTDIEKLRSSIPAGTVVIQPVLLTNVKNVPNTVAIFIVTKDQLSVIKNPIDPTEFDKLVTEYREQLQNPGDATYIETSAKIYNILIRPVEDKIKAFSPKQLSIIATGKLRYIPFETLFDEQTNQYLIQKYPINYLTRLSSRFLNSNRETVARNSLQKGVFALANPIPRDPQNLPGTEEEVRNIAQLFPGSESFFHDNATLDKFKTFAPRFPFLHLATHGCFQPEGCQKLGMKANTLLFADQQLNIADAALLGLQNTELLTLSACQTALQANSNGEEIAGLAYIFERAGAKAVMASLWNAEDNTTKDIMIQFYQNIKNGMSKGEALQKAKLTQIGRHPYYWSPFILIGDAR